MLVDSAWHVQQLNIGNQLVTLLLPSKEWHYYNS